MPAVSKGDGMRGLAVFISDIRNCKFVDLTHSQILCWLVISLFAGVTLDGVSDPTGTCPEASPFPPHSQFWQLSGV